MNRCDYCRAPRKNDDECVYYCAVGYFCDKCGVDFINSFKQENTILLGFTGKIGCGKSTAAEYLCNVHNMNFIEYSFAKPLKEIACLMGFKRNEVFGTQADKLKINDFWGISGRTFLQKFGSEVCRDYLPKVLSDMKFNNKTLWIRLFEQYYEEYKNSNIIVSDVRFEDECSAIRSLGGYIIRIERNNHDSSNEINDTVIKHKSETQMDNIKPQFIIRNNGSLDELYKKLNEAIKLIIQGFADIPNVTIYI